jgi:hypothetical protein
MRHFVAVIAASAFAGSALAGFSAGVSSFTGLNEFTKIGPSIGKWPSEWVTYVTSETLSGFANGDSFTKLSGGSGWNQWVMTASPGTMSISNGVAIANEVGAGLSFDLGPALGNSGSGLHGFGADFGFLDANGKRVAGTVELMLSTGDALVTEISPMSSFAGFWSLDAGVTITGMTLRPLGTAGENYRATVDNLYFGFAGVPAPGAVALLGMAGAVSARRRRR